MFNESPYKFKDRASKTIYDEIVDTLCYGDVATTYNFTVETEGHLIDAIKQQLIHDGYIVEVENRATTFNFDSMQTVDTILMTIYYNKAIETISKDDLIKQGKWNPYKFF